MASHSLACLPRRPARSSWSPEHPTFSLAPSFPWPSLSRFPLPLARHGRGRAELGLPLLRSPSVPTKRSTTSLSSRRTSTGPRIINSATAVRCRQHGCSGSRRRAWLGHLGPSSAQLSSPTGERCSWDAPRLFPTTAGDLPPPESTIPAMSLFKSMSRTSRLN